MRIDQDGRNDQSGACNLGNNNGLCLVKQESAAKKAKAIDAMSTNTFRASASTSNSENIKSNTAYPRVTSRRKVRSEFSRESGSRNETSFSSIYRDKKRENVDGNSKGEKWPLEIHMDRCNGGTTRENGVPTRTEKYPSSCGAGEKRNSKVMHGLMAYESHINDLDRQSLKSYTRVSRTKAFSWKKYDRKNSREINQRKIEHFDADDGGRLSLTPEKTKTPIKGGLQSLESTSAVYHKSKKSMPSSSSYGISSEHTEEKINFAKNLNIFMETCGSTSDVAKTASYKIKLHGRKLDSIKPPRTPIIKSSPLTSDRKTALKLQAKTDASATVPPRLTQSKHSNYSTKKAMRNKNKKYRYNLKPKKKREAPPQNMPVCDINSVNRPHFHPKEDKKSVSRQADHQVCAMPGRPENNADKICIANATATAATAVGVTTGVVSASVRKSNVILKGRHQSRSRKDKKVTSVDTSEKSCAQAETLSRPTSPIQDDHADGFHSKFEISNQCDETTDNDKNKYESSNSSTHIKKLRKRNGQIRSIPVINGANEIPSQNQGSNSKFPNSNRLSRGDRKLKSILARGAAPNECKTRERMSVPSLLSRDSLEDGAVDKRAPDGWCASPNLRTELSNSIKKELRLQIEDYMRNLNGRNPKKPDRTPNKSLNPSAHNILEEETACTSISSTQTNHDIDTPVKVDKANSKKTVSYNNTKAHKNVRFGDSIAREQGDTYKNTTNTSEIKNENRKKHVMPNDVQYLKENLSEFLALLAETPLKRFPDLKGDDQDIFTRDRSPESNGNVKLQESSQENNLTLMPNLTMTKEIIFNKAIKSKRNLKETSKETLQTAFDIKRSCTTNKDDMMCRNMEIPQLREGCGEQVQRNVHCIKSLHLTTEPSNERATRNDGRSSSPFTTECAWKHGKFQPPELRMYPVENAGRKISPAINSALLGPRHAEKNKQSLLAFKNQVVNDGKLNNLCSNERCALPCRTYSYPRVDRIEVTNRTNWLEKPRSGCKNTAAGQNKIQSEFRELPFVADVETKNKELNAYLTDHAIPLKHAKQSFNIPEKIQLFPMSENKTHFQDISKSVNEPHEKNIVKSVLMKPYSATLPEHEGQWRLSPSNQNAQCYVADGPLGNNFMVLEDKNGNLSYVRTTNEESEGARFDEAFADNLHTSSEMTSTRDHYTPPPCSRKTSDSQGAPDKTPVAATRAEINEEWSHPHNHENHQYHPRPKAKITLDAKGSPQGECFKHENAYIEKPPVFFTSLTPTMRKEKLTQGQGFEAETSTVTRSYASSIGSENSKSKSRVFVRYRKKITITGDSEDETLFSGSQKAPSNCNKSKQTTFTIFGRPKPEQSDGKSHSKKNTFRGFFSRSNKVAASSASEGLNEWPSNRSRAASPTKTVGKFSPRDALKCRDGVKGESAPGGGLKETLWGVTQVNVYNDGSKTFELRKPGKKKPWRVPEEIENIFVLPAPKPPTL